MIKIMSKQEIRRKKIDNLLGKLFSLYMDEKKPIMATYNMLGMHYKLTFNAENLNKTKEYLKGIDIWCKNKNQANRCCKLADKLGWKWKNNESFIDENNWDFYEENTCYDFYEGEFSCKKSEVYGCCSIKSAKWFIDNFTPKDI